MFNLELSWDYPAKYLSGPTDHVLRVRILPQANQLSSGLPLHLALALDTSSSMQGEKLQQAKVACQSVIAQLRASDQLSLASFATRVVPLLQAVSGSSSSSAHASVDQLKAEGVTRVDLALDWIQSVLPVTSGVARVGILITDGHPTTNQGQILKDVTPVVHQGEQLAAQGIVLCTVGLGNAANFNTAFLVNLSDQGRGAFLYADTPTQLTPLLQERLAACQAIAIDGAVLKIAPIPGVEVVGFCRFRPEYLPLEETATHELMLGPLQANTPTDILLHLTVPGLGFAATRHSQEVIKVELNAPGIAPQTAQAELLYTNIHSELQNINPDVNQDRLFWEMNLYTTELTRTTDPKRTGELLLNYQVNALKTGQQGIADQAAEQLQELEESGQINPHTTTKLVQTSRKLGGN